MSEQATRAGTGGPPGPPPIFEIDMPCPRCEYNLRGLTEPRCPECGEAFDPHTLLLRYRDQQPPLPLLQVVRRMYRHPLEFWALREVQLSQGPRRMQLFFGLIYVPVLAAMLLGYSRLRARLGMGAAVVVVAGLQSLLVSLAVYMFCLVHGLLCRIGLAAGSVREGARAAKEVVGYGLVWFGPLLLGTILALRLKSALLVPGASLPRQLWAGAGICIAAASCAAWAATLYEGGKFVSGGRRFVAIWCVLSNPAWYLLALVAMMALG